MEIIIVSNLKMIELFAGIGGFQLAADWVGGIETIASVEINPFCQKVLAKNHPKTPLYNDVTSYSPKANQAQIVCGGSPCQDLSIAGKQKGIIEGKRSSLWFEQLRIYQESKATFLIWENVPGALRNGFGEVLRSLSSIGCNAEWETISASALGAPHPRDRIFLIAYPSSVQFHQESSPWSDQVGCQAAIASTYPTEIATDTDNTQSGHITEPIKARQSKHINSSRLTPWSTIEPPVCGVDARLPDRLDRLSALGNAIVPQCAIIPLLRVKYLAGLIA